MFDDGVLNAELELERLAQKWESLFNLACRDRDAWQQHAEKLETVTQNLRNQLREELTHVAITKRLVVYLLETITQLPDPIFRAVTNRMAQAEEYQTYRGYQAARNKRENSGETPDPRPPGGESEGLC